MRFMMLMIPKGYETAAPGTTPDPKARGGDDEVQRGAAEGRRAAGARRPASAIGSRAGHVCRRDAERDRRSVRRGQGSRRRLLDDPGAVARRSDPVGHALPGRRRTKRSKCARSSRCPSFRPRSRRRWEISSCEVRLPRLRRRAVDAHGARRGVHGQRAGAEVERPLPRRRGAAAGDGRGDRPRPSWRDDRHRRSRSPRRRSSSPAST